MLQSGCFECFVIFQMHVAIFKCLYVCFNCFGSMLQLLHPNVTNLDMHVCCTCYNQIHLPSPPIAVVAAISDIFASRHAGLVHMHFLQWWCFRFFFHTRFGFIFTPFFFGFSGFSCCFSSFFAYMKLK
jgi:hypothetical protein